MQSSASCTSLALKLTAGTHVSAGVPNAASRIEGGTPTFRHVTLALTAAGFSTFTVLYCVQPFLPVLKYTFHVSPAESGLALPLCTGLLAVSLLIAGPFSENWGPRAAPAVPRVRHRGPKFCVGLAAIGLAATHGGRCTSLQCGRHRTEQGWVDAHMGGDPVNLA